MSSSVPSLSKALDFPEEREGEKAGNWRLPLLPKERGMWAGNSIQLSFILDLSVFQVTDHTPRRDLGKKGILSIPSFALSLINLYPDSNGIASLFPPPSCLFWGGKIHLDRAQTLCFSTLGLGAQLCQDSSQSHRRNGVKATKLLEFPCGCWDKAPLVSKENPLGWSGITGNAGRERG